MGIFSSKKKTYVGTSASRLIEDNMVPNSILAGVTKAVLKDGEISASVLNELRRGIGSKARSMYNYGRNNYIFGTPDANIQSNVVGESQLLAVLQTLFAGAIVIEYHHLGAPNILHIARQKLMASHGYNPVTNQLGALTTSTGFPVFVHDLVVVLPTATAANYSLEATAQWGTTPKMLPSPTRKGLAIVPQVGALATFTPVEINATATEDHVRVQYAWPNAANAVQQSSFIIGNSEFEEAADYFQVSFTHGGVQKYWTYKAGQGTYPSLDALVDTGGAGQSIGTFFPMIHFRNNKQSMAANPLSQEYLQSVRMAKKLGVDYMEIHDAIHDNPDIADVAQAYLTLLVPVMSTNKVDRQYLFDFFDQLLDAGLGVPAGTTDLTPFKTMRAVARTAILVQDTKVKHTLSCTGITKKLVAGNIGAIGDYSSGFVATPAANEHHFFKRQITPDVYEELNVVGLEMRYWVDGKYSAVGDDADAALMIPMDYSISRNYPMPVQEVLYARSLHLIANSSVTVKIKWYQRPAFATFLQIVGIVLFFIDGGFTAALANAIAQGVIAVITFIVVTVLVNLVVKFAFELLAKILGPEFAILVAVVAAVVGFAKGLEAGFKAALPTITQMLQLATGLLNGASKVVMDDLMDLSKEFEAFKDEAKEQMKLLEDTKSLLENSARLNPLVIFGETPDNYFNRTVHSGNVGTIGYQVIESYADMALTLPTISDSLGGAQNE